MEDKPVRLDGVTLGVVVCLGGLASIGTQWTIHEQNSRHPIEPLWTWLSILGVGLVCIGACIILKSARVRLPDHMRPILIVRHNGKRALQTQRPRLRARVSKDELRDRTQSAITAINSYISTSRRVSDLTFDGMSALPPGSSVQDYEVRFAEGSAKSRAASEALSTKYQAEVLGEVLWLYEQYSARGMTSVPLSSGPMERILPDLALFENSSNTHAWAEAVRFLGTWMRNL